MTRGVDDHAEGETTTPVTESAAGAAAHQSGPGRPRRRGRAVAYLALLAAVVAGAGYLHWRGQGRVAALSDELAEANLAADRRDDLSASTDRLRAEVGEMRQELQRQKQALQTQQQALEEARGALAEAMAEHRDQRPPRPREWRIAELEHLLRGANQRMLMDHDMRGARQLLHAAEDLLAELDDFTLHEVRALVVEDIAALGRYRGADVQGVFLRLEALRGAFAELPLRLPRFLGAREAPASAPRAEGEGEGDSPPSFLHAVLGRFKGLVRFRRHQGDAVRPLLPPEQAEYLQQHLLLAVDRAQLAALRRHQAVFDASLAAVDEWLGAYLDPTAETVRGVRAQVDALRQVELATRPPDLSRPLARLRQLRDPLPAARGDAADEPAAQ